MDPTSDLRSMLHHSWGWLLALGIVLILFGGLILTTPLGSSLTTEIWIAMALVAAGALQLAHGLRPASGRARLADARRCDLHRRRRADLRLSDLGLLSLTMIVA
jgi:hypothetical protein